MDFDKSTIVHGKIKLNHGKHYGLNSTNSNGVSYIKVVPKQSSNNFIKLFVHVFFGVSCWDIRMIRV